mgnify:CR=1 FL=1
MKKIILFLLVIIVTIVISFIVTMKLNSYNLFRVNIPKKIPQGFKRISIVKKIPPEKDWYFIATYENAKKQQLIFHYEPHRDIRCEGGFWQKNLLDFRPAGSSKGCSFYMDQLKNNKPVQLHWFLWNRDDKTYHIYDQESVLAEKEAMDMADSVGQKIVIAQDLTKKK